MTPSYQQVLDNRLEEVNAQIQAWPSSHKGKVSDGYHTIDELYDHRIALWIQLCKSEQCLLTNKITSKPVWRSQAHSDGSVWPDWFLLGVGIKAGEQLTYHLPMSVWSQTEFALTLDKAPDFDGHTSADVLERLKNL